jgi:LPS-assembly protein
MRALHLFALALMLATALPVAARAESMTLSGDLPWELEADRIQVFPEAGIVEAWGNVTMTRGEDFVSAEYARYYWETQWVYLKGGVNARWRGDTMEAELAEFDLENLVGWLRQGRIFFADASLHLEGDDLRKTGPNSYAFSSAVVTSCEGERPAWSISSQEGEVVVDGYARLRGTRFRVLDIPLLYSPYLVLPIKVTRQSGLLVPEFSQSSRNGYSVNLPLYWAIDEERDLTLYAHYMTERGYMQGLEYRHTPDVLTKGLWHADFLYDRTRARTETEEESQFQGDGLLRPDPERYWLRGKYSGFALDPRWQLEIDTDLVSDQNYLREFNRGYSGFRRSRADFLETFGRDIDEDDSLTRTNQVLLRRSWSNVEFNALARYTQSLPYWTGNLSRQDDPTTQRLPELNLDIYRTRLAGTPLEVQARNQAVYFWRRYGTRGTRVDIHPRAGLPVDLAYGTVTPSVGWRQTAWFIDSFEVETGAVDTGDRTLARGLPDVNVNAFTQLDRVFKTGEAPLPVAQEVGRSKLTRVRHAVQFDADWDYIPFEDQEQYPFFDFLDRIGPRNELTYSVVNLLTGRRDSVVRRNAGTQPVEDAAELVTSYQDLLWLSLEQSYDFREATRDSELNEFPRRPFSDVALEISLRPRRYLSLDSTTWYSVYDNRITEHEHLLRLFFGERGTTYFGLDFLEEVDNDIRRRDQSELTVLRVGGRMLLTSHWAVSLDHRHDLVGNETLETEVGIEYMHQCYALRALFTHTPFDDRIEFRVDLRGL